MEGRRGTGGGGGGGVGSGAGAGADSLAAAFEAGQWPPRYNHPIAHSRLEYFLGRWGKAGLRDLLREWSKRGTLDAALRAVTGLDEAELERAWGSALAEKWER